MSPKEGEGVQNSSDRQRLSCTYNIEQGGRKNDDFCVTSECLIKLQNELSKAVKFRGS